MAVKFDKNKVLEKILEEAPILSNRRGEIEVEIKVEENNKLIKKKEKRTIYAYYFNRGVSDPDLKYDKVNSPIKTTPDSTLAEVYSFWEGDPNVQKLRQRLEKEGGIKEGEIIYGPWVEGASNDKETIEKVREGFWDYNFHNSAIAFKWHFNKIAKELCYNTRLINLAEERLGFFDCGAYVIQASRMISYSVNSKIKEGLMNIRVPINLNLNRIDPKLSEMLDIINKSYQRIQNTDFSDSIIYLQ